MTTAVFRTPSLLIAPDEFARATGWEAKPEGLCLGARCVPAPLRDGMVDVSAFAERMGMAIVRDDAAGLWALGPESGGHALASAEAPDFELPDLDGRLFRLSSLRGQKVFLHAWASW